jgi:hypothetical protein
MLTMLTLYGVIPAGITALVVVALARDLRRVVRRQRLRAAYRLGMADRAAIFGRMTVAMAGMVPAFQQAARAAAKMEADLAKLAAVMKADAR